jgi:hypothetical protein
MAGYAAIGGKMFEKIGTRERAWRDKTWRDYEYMYGDAGERVRICMLINGCHKICEIVAHQRQV